MNGEKSLLFSLRDLNLQNEAKVNEALRINGLYSESRLFPLASLQFELTSHCNMFCRHCYNNSGTDNTHADRMTPHDWVEFSQYISNKGGVFECILSGGEPLLLGDSLFRIMDILHDDGTIFMVLTNGFLLSKIIVDTLQKYKYHWIQVSIDGFSNEYHDQFRNCIGSWKKAVSGALLVADSGLPLKIAHCVTPYNIDGIDEMCKLAYSIGARAITIGELCLSGRTGVNQGLLLSPEQRVQLKEKISEVSAMYEGRMRVKSSNEVKKGLERHRKRPMSNAVIRPNGDIRIDSMAPFIIGNVLDDDFSTVWQNKANNSWNDPRVISYINGFGEDDRNHKMINYDTDECYL